MENTLAEESHVMDDRLRIPQDDPYFHAVGLATIAFARLEWNAVWCCERLKQGYINTIEQEKKTAGKIGNDLKILFSRVSNVNLRSRIVPLAEEFLKVVEQRNGLVHGQPGTTPNGDQRLFRHGSAWSIDTVNEFSDRCVVVAAPLNALLHGELKEPCTVTLQP